MWDEHLRKLTFLSPAGTLIHMTGFLVVSQRDS